MTLERITTHPDPYEPFLLSQGIRVGNLVFISNAQSAADSQQVRLAHTPVESEWLFTKPPSALFGNHLITNPRVSLFLQSWAHRE